MLEYLMGAAALGLLGAVLLIQLYIMYLERQYFQAQGKANEMLDKRIQDLDRRLQVLEPPPPHKSSVRSGVK